MKSQGRSFESEESKQLVERVEKLAQEATLRLDDCDFAGGFEAIAEIATLANTNLAMQEFWNLAKKDANGTVDMSKLDLLEELLFVNFETLRILSLLLTPYCPQTASQMLTVVNAATSPPPSQGTTSSTLGEVTTVLGDNSR